MNRTYRWIFIVAIVALATPQLQAAVIFWQGGAGALTDANYSDGTNPNLAPLAADVVNFGNGGTATHSVAGTTSFTRLRVGHNQNAPAPGGAGQGTVTITNGAVNLTNSVSGVPALMVGQQQNGTLSIDGAGSSVTSARLIVIGSGTNTARNGTVNVTNGATLTATLGNIVLGETSGTALQGVQGHMFVNGNVTIAEAGADLNIGPAGATATFTQIGGTVSVGDVIEVGTASGTNSNSSFSISGGSATHGGNFFVGRGTTSGATVNISGTAVLNTGNRFLMGGGTATGVTVNHSGGTLNTMLDVRVADAGNTDSTYNLSGTGVINSTTGGFVGRQGVGKFFQTGGEANFNGALSIGNREAAANPANGLYEISAGELNVATALNIAPKGTGELRVIGDDATIDVNGGFSLGNTIDGIGTLAFELETGDSLALIDVSGAATFTAGSNLVMDASNAAPTQFVYNLLTATSIVDNGIAFSAPAGWSYRIISGGNGQILQAVVPEPGTVTLALLAVAMVLGRRRT